MTTAELDKALAEMMGYEYERPYLKTYTIAKVNGSWIKWNPTDKNSNQIVRYVFPKLFERSNVTLTIEVSFGFSESGTTINNGGIVSECFLSDPDDINKTMAIACVEAFEKITPTNAKGDN